MSNFPKRNRIISALSEGILVVEARHRSGSTITANLGFKQGKKVFCVPSNIDSKLGVGTNKLIQKGAKLVINVEDIFVSLVVRLLLSAPLLSEIKKQSPRTLPPVSWKILNHIIPPFHR